MESVCFFGNSKSARPKEALVILFFSILNLGGIIASFDYMGLFKYLYSKAS